MRILFFSDKKTKMTEQMVKSFKSDLFATVDFFTDLEEASYCMDIRSYDLAIIEYKESFYKKYYNLLGASRKKEENVIIPKIIFFGEEMSKEIQENFSKYDVNLFKSGFENLLEESLEVLLENDDISIIERENLIVNVKTKEIFFVDNNKKTKLIFKKKIDFFVLLYFIRHYQEIINISCLLDATCEEPELTKDSIIEASISSIRKTFQSVIGKNPIKAFKKIGYQFSLS